MVLQVTEMIIFKESSSRGSNLIHDRFNELGISHEFYAEDGLLHEYWGSVNGNWVGGPNEYFEQSQRPPVYFYCLLYTSPSPRDATLSRMPSSA